VMIGLGVVFGARGSWCIPRWTRVRAEDLLCGVTGCGRTLACSESARRD